MSDTPRTDAVARAVGAAAMRWKGREIDVVTFCEQAESALDDLRKIERELNETKNQVRILYAAYQSESALTTRLEKHATDLEQRLTIVKSAAEASVDRAHTQGVMDSILRQEIGRLMDEVAELIKDRERLDKAEAERWQMTYDQRAAGFLIQEQHRVVGHIGRGTTLRAAIDEAMGVK